MHYTSKNLAIIFSAPTQKLTNNINQSQIIH